MAGHTNKAFRTLVRSSALALCWSEFVSAHALHHNSSRIRTQQLMDWDDKEPVGVQIFGWDPDLMALTAQESVAKGAKAIDINLGCWVPKIAKKGAGSALLKKPQQLQAICRAVVQAVPVPVTAKMRIVDRHDHKQNIELAQLISETGIQLLTVHPRLPEEGFKNHADHRCTREIAQNISIPVVANGDITSHEQAKKVLEATGCHGVMIGREALKRPWIFTYWNSSDQPNLAEKASWALKHLHLSLSLLNRSKLEILRRFRGQLSQYNFGLPKKDQQKWRKIWTSCFSESDFVQALTLLGSVDI